MTDTTARPVPRWLFALAALAGAVSLFLLMLGQLVTTLKAGMADPLWPTEPWYLIENYKDEAGYLVEHSHRIAGFVLGGVLGVLALGMWGTEPRAWARWVGVVAVTALLGGFGEFHRDVMNQEDPNRLEVPGGAVGVMGGSLLVLAVVGASGVAGGVRGSALRLYATGVLVAVMGQGLLGGLRVKLNALHGPELAAVHGVFAQVVFSLLVLLALFCTRPPQQLLSARGRGWVGGGAVILVGLLFGQLVLGVLVRHMPTPLAQRLHFLTAFLALAVIVWVLRAGFSNPLTRPRVITVGWFLGLLVGAQLVLGVEAWMGKFSDEARGETPATSFYVETAIPTPYQTVIRTAHVMIGTGVLASAVVLAVNLRRSTSGVRGPVTESPDRPVAVDSGESVFATAGSQPGVSS